MDDEPVHWLTEVKAHEYTTGCGPVLVSKKGMPDTISGWWSDITCALCASRTIFHRKFTSWEELMNLIDLDDPAVAQRFHFKGKRYHFRWLVDGRLIYVYEYEHSFSAVCAIHLEHDQESTYENAQARAKEFILSQMIKFGLDFVDPSYEMKAKKGVRATPKVIIPTGPHCDICKKPDEGDCVESPDDVTLLRCMTCYIKLAR